MRTYTKEEISSDGNFKTIRYYRERIKTATPLKELEGWKVGKPYSVVLNKLWNGKYSICRELGPGLGMEPDPEYREPGYKVFDSFEELGEYFSYVIGTEMYDQQEVKVEQKREPISIKY